MTLFSKKDFRLMLCVTDVTLTRWEQSGKLVPVRCTDGNAYYTSEQYVQYFREKYGIEVPEPTDLPPKFKSLKAIANEKKRKKLKEKIAELRQANIQ